MQNKIRAGIIGGAGYTGGELIRILLNHPNAEISFIHSKSNAGNPVALVHRDLEGETDLVFSDKLDDADVLFLCAGHGEAKKFLEGNNINASTKIIDLSQDFRLKDSASHGERQFVYGLPELNLEAIRTASNIANPGCFATAIQLGLLPLAKHSLVKDVYSTGITGSTGAGQALTDTSQFSWRANNIQAYKTLSHQHVNEITESLQSLDNEFPKNGSLNFVPWRGDFTRGIFISSQLKCDLDLKQVNELYQDFYNKSTFTKISKSPVFLKQVVNTNKCLIQLEKVGTNLVVHSVIDNLLKGASGQAVQNMNLVFGFEENAGLKLKANYF